MENMKRDEKMERGVGSIDVEKEMNGGNETR